MPFIMLFIDTERDVALSAQRVSSNARKTTNGKTNTPIQ